MLWEEDFESLLDLVKEYVLDVLEERKSRLYGKNACAQQPTPQSPTGVLGDIAGVKVWNGKGLCQGGKPELCNDVFLCGSAHSSGCVVGALVLWQLIEYYYYYREVIATNMH